MSEIQSEKRILLLMRHAKSSWKEASLADHDRPLKKRGFHDASRMGRLLVDRGLVPEKVVTSSARRAVQTAELVADVCGNPPIIVEPGLYEAASSDWLPFSAVDSGLSRILMVGHNPSLDELVSQIAGEAVHMPTAAIACISLPEGSDPAGINNTTLVDIWRPKEL